MKTRVLPTLLALVLCGSSLYPSAGALEQSFQNPQLSRDEGAVTLKVQAPALSGQKVWMALYQEGKMEALALATQALEHELTATAQFSGDFDQVKLFGLDADGSPLILPLEAEYRGADLVITQPGLYQLGSYNNVIIDPSVGDGSVSLVNMEIGGDLLVQGGGGNTVALTGGTAVLGKISVEKAADGGQAPRLLLQDAQVERISLVTPGAVVEAGQPVQVVQLTASAGAQLRGPLQIEQVKAGGDLTAGAQTALGELAVLAGGTFHLAGPVGQIQLEEGSSGARLTLCSGSTLVSGPGEAEQVRVSGQADVWVNATVTQAAVAGDAVGAGLTLDGVADTVAVEAGGTARQITLYAPTSLTVAGQVEELNVITAESVRAEGTGSVAAVNASEPSALQLEGGLV